MKFFKPEDFNAVFSYVTGVDVCKIANAKLERDCVVVYGTKIGNWSPTYGKASRIMNGKRAMLINIGPIVHETAADVLRDMVNGLEAEPNLVYKEEWYSRAKAVLERDES